MLLLILLLTHSGLYGVEVDFLKGKFHKERVSSFVKLPKKYSGKANSYLQKKTWRAFKEMWKAAHRDGVSLYVVSAVRTFTEQREIWNAKFAGRRKVAGFNLAKKFSSHIQRAKEILKFSSMPGTSRHHWGTDIDIVASPTMTLTNRNFSSGKGLKAYQWLRKNAAQYGFCQTLPFSPGKYETRENTY